MLGGVDVTGPSLYTIYPHGSTDKLPYVTMGSGSLAAMAIFEAGWRPELTVRIFVSNILGLHFFFVLCRGSKLAISSTTPSRLVFSMI